MNSRVLFGLDFGKFEKCIPGVNTRVRARAQLR